MKAVVCKGPFSVVVEDVPDPTIERPADATITKVLLRPAAA